jgi:hypothetical protein
MPRKQCLALCGNREPVTRLPTMMEQGSDSHDRTYKGSLSFFDTPMGFSLGVNGTGQDCSSAGPIGNLLLGSFLRKAQNNCKKNLDTSANGPIWFVIYCGLHVQYYS